MSEWSLPDGWRSQSLGEIADVVFSNVDKKTVAGEKPVLLCNYMDVYSNEYITHKLNFMEATASAAEIARFSVQEGDVIATKDSETPEDIGVPAVVVEDIPNLVCGYHLTQIKPHRDIVNPVFLSKQIAHDRIARYFSRLANGSTRYGLSTSSFDEMPVWLPGLSRQCKIARILTTLDELIEYTESLIAKYQVIKQGLMHDLFTRGVDEDGHLRSNYEDAPELYKESELGWIPKEWEVSRLGRFLDAIGGYLQTGPFGSQLHAYEYVSDGVAVIMPQDINEGVVGFASIARVTEEKAATMARHRVQANDIVFSRRGDLSRAAAITNTEAGAICGTGCFLLRAPSDGLNSQWLATIYSHEFVQKQVEARAVGSTMPSLNNAVMAGLQIAFPEVEEQAAIVHCIANLDAIIRQCGQHASKLRLQKTGLMQDLLTGVVTVKLDDEEADNG
ncbi:MAG: hypothetical protein CME33_04370 [Gimesia sp.]|uniref:restriction endonuclease subunit S n=1 Tax=Gimesia sp. TaxID=2024833 RepID=UPI000C427CFF|nr:restriction endonuclease subunit S [Gimesia sp.]MAX35788.1 hypothetical protein [Gimesia sp.]|tara:strand:+ start:4785 stop:6125 length:1341 start_codon:yes stop_codon:yes gene_type:complete